MCNKNAELREAILLGRWERDLVLGSNVQLQTYTTVRIGNSANFAESRDIL